MTSLTMSATLFKNIQSALHLVEEAQIKFDADGMHVRMVDPAHVAMVSMNVPKATFVKYDCPTEAVIKIDLGKWKDVGKLASASDNVEITITEDSIKYKVGNVRRSARLLEASDGDVKIPNLNLPGKATVNVAELKRAVKATEGSDHLAITISVAGLLFDSKDESTESQMSIPADNLKDLAFGDGSCRSLFPMDYFSDIVGGFPEGTVLLTMGNDLPMKMRYDGDFDLTCLLAPRIENET